MMRLFAVCPLPAQTGSVKQKLCTKVTGAAAATEQVAAAQRKVYDLWAAALGGSRSHR